MRRHRLELNQLPGIRILVDGRPRTKRMQLDRAHVAGRKARVKSNTREPLS